MKIKNYEAGFTLIELLTSIIVLIAIGSVIAGIIASSLRGTNKTNTIENIRQNGNYALAQMSKDITYALPFDGKNTGFSADDITYVASCPFSSDPTPAPVSTIYNFITVDSENNRIIKYNCSGFNSQNSVLTANGTSLIDTDSVSLKSCSLTCTQSKGTDTPIIKINFSIGPKNPNGLVESSNPPIVFQTSVTPRNYQR